MSSLGIIDYGAGNLSSVCNSFRAIGYEARLVRESRELEGLTHLVLPGVGSFGDCSRALCRQGLDDAIRSWIREDRPFLGICIGYQILFEDGEESPGASGLGLFRGHVRRFGSHVKKIPHMGWNCVTPADPAAPLWKGLGENPYFYFVHSYYPVPEDPSLAAASCTYGDTFAAAIIHGHVAATQFHPEKSQTLGLRLLDNFMHMNAR